VKALGRFTDSNSRGLVYVNVVRTKSGSSSADAGLDVVPAPCGVVPAQAVVKIAAAAATCKVRGDN
jgi:hypothetical protein